MAVCVEIQVGDDGAISVRECDPKEESMNEAGEQAGQTVESIDEAFQIAEGILMGVDEGAEEQAFTKGMGNMMGGTKPAMPKGGM